MATKSFESYISSCWILLPLWRRNMCWNQLNSEEKSHNDIMCETRLIMCDFIFCTENGHLLFKIKNAIRWRLLSKTSAFKIGFAISPRGYLADWFWVLFGMHLKFRFFIFISHPQPKSTELLWYDAKLIIQRNKALWICRSRFFCPFNFHFTWASFLYCVVNEWVLKADFN